MCKVMFTAQHHPTLVHVEDRADCGRYSAPNSSAEKRFYQLHRSSRAQLSCPIPPHTVGKSHNSSQILKFSTLNSKRVPDEIVYNSDKIWHPMGSKWGPIILKSEFSIPCKLAKKLRSAFNQLQFEARPGLKFQKKNRREPPREEVEAQTQGMLVGIS